MPECGSLLLKKTGRNAKIYCYNENCKYERKIDKNEADENKDEG